MKLSIDTGALVKRFGEDKAFKMIKNAGFDAVDFSLYWINEDKKEVVFGDNYLEYAKNIRDKLDNLGLVCNQAHAPFDFNSKNDTIDITNENYIQIVKSMEIASILGAENIVIHAIWPYDGESILESNYKYYKSFEKYCEKFNIHIAVENLFGGSYNKTINKYSLNKFGTPYTMCEFINKLNSEWFVCCIDTGHATVIEDGVEPEVFIKNLNNNILKALHIQDTDYADDRHTLPYLGKINWDNVINSLKEIKYNGDITFEIFKYLDSFNNELINDALKLAASVGHNLINKFNNLNI